MAIPALAGLAWLGLCKHGGVKILKVLALRGKEALSTLLQRPAKHAL